MSMTRATRGEDRNAQTTNARANDILNASAGCCRRASSDNLYTIPDPHASNNARRWCGNNADAGILFLVVALISIRHDAGPSLRNQSKIAGVADASLFLMIRGRSGKVAGWMEIMSGGNSVGDGLVAFPSDKVDVRIFMEVV